MEKEKKKKSRILKDIAIGCGSLLGLFIILIIVGVILGSGTPSFDKTKSPTNQTPITLSAKSAYKNAKIDFYQDDTKTQVLKSDSHGKFSIKVDLKEGDNKFKATATNDKGKSKTSSEINIVYDKTPPTIVLGQTQFETNSDKAEISGETENNSTITLLTNDKEIGKTTAKDGKFKFNIKELKIGENKFKIIAVDQAGNQSESKEITIARVLSKDELKKAEEEAAAKAKQEAEAKQKAEQEAEAKQRAEDEAKRKAEEEAKKWQPINLSGYGQQATDKFTLQSGLSIFKMNHNGSGNFAIWLIDRNGDKVELLVNEIGTFDGSKAVGIISTGDYLLDVTASSSWSVNITQPR